MSATTPSNKPSEGVHKRVAELKTLRDQVRVNLNLATKEARDRWHRLEERIRSAQERIRRSKGVHALGPLVESVKRFRTSLRRKSKSA